ncbi:MAG: class I SAM-dependent RNA methyltransferase [Spirochaetaceae bacterium]|jgi:putative N6-adenine-specific DNA methylase|nr:class I SAM-dependent RNA methyltransferase [Spirochaetaceae bacterium]
MIVVALCSGGLEKLVSNEIRKFTGDFRIIDSGFGKVRFETNLRGVYYALLSFRAVDRLLLEAAYFPASDFDELFEGTRAVAWEDYIPKGMGLAVDKVRSNHSRLAAETAIQAIVHKAAAERLCKHYSQNRLTESGETVELRVYIEKDQAQILIDLCGSPLFKRGYRIEGGTAPLRESTAAALLLQSLWRRKYPLYDPFCGSGTIVIEAALFAWDIAPGLLGRRFALSALAIACEKTENDVRRELSERIDTSKIIQIYGSDSDSGVVETAKTNLSRILNSLSGMGDAGVKPPPPNCKPKLWWRKMEEAKAPADDGYIITNPPYGIRLLDKEGAEAVYRSMAVLKHNFPRWKINVLSAHAGFEAFFGSNASRCKKITAGASETYFYEYDFVERKAEHIQNSKNAQNRRDMQNTHDTYDTQNRRDIRGRNAVKKSDIIYTW